MNSRILLALLSTGLVLALAGCKQQATGPSDAPAEVLSGTISDAMLPYDTVTSQPPLDPRVVRTARPGAAPEAEATEGAAATPAPAGSAPAAVSAGPAE